ncbi:MAG: epoxyqueuosine reductase [Planctomycetota bacterium]|jgi:epoxyqueuosine reductase
MTLLDPEEAAGQLIEQARALGATLAGIVSVPALRDAPSWESSTPPVFPSEAKSVLVVCRSLSPEEERLDWWDGPGGTPLNRDLMGLCEALGTWAEEVLGIETVSLPYHAQRGGVYLKDASALAGLGVIGANNLLVTEAFGPRVRLRAMLLDQALPSGHPPDFTPCRECEKPCQHACPQNAFPSGVFNRERCQRQMRSDESRGLQNGGGGPEGPRVQAIRYCRVCELACPVGT